jgi:hypothetical protein
MEKVTRQNPALIRLLCDWNNLTSLDVSQNTEIRTIGCSNNNLTNIDVSQNTELYQLLCYDNNLTSLDVDYNIGLIDLDCKNNQLNASVLNALFRSLPIVSLNRIINISGNPGASDCDKSYCYK